MRMIDSIDSISLSVMPFDGLGDPSFLSFESVCTSTYLSVSNFDDVGFARVGCLVTVNLFLFVVV